MGDNKRCADRTGCPSPLGVIACCVPPVLPHGSKVSSALPRLQTPVGPLERMLTRARRLFDARAFVHRYERHGLACPTDFDEAFEAAEGLLDAYRQL